MRPIHRISEDVLRPAPESDPSSQAAFPEVPVLPSTLLGLELLLQRPAFDLAQAARLLGTDPGAVLHLFGMVAAEFPDETGRPVRLNECMANLSPRRLLGRLAGAPLAQRSRREHTQFAGFAAHAAEIGQSAQAVADSLGLPREQAFLVGLLHELGCLPPVLGWRGEPWRPVSAVLCCEQLARSYGLPDALRSALDDVHRERADSVWTAVIAAAHDLLEPADRSVLTV